MWFEFEPGPSGGLSSATGFLLYIPPVKRTDDQSRGIEERWRERRTECVGSRGRLETLLRVEVELPKRGGNGSIRVRLLKLLELFPSGIHLAQTDLRLRLPEGGLDVLSAVKGRVNRVLR